MKYKYASIDKLDERRSGFYLYFVLMGKYSIDNLKIIILRSDNALKFSLENNFIFKVNIFLLKTAVQSGR